MRLARFIISLSFIPLVMVVSVDIYLAQDKAQHRPKLKHFGSSLMHLEWDPENGQAIERKKTRSASNPANDDIVRIDTNLVSTDVLVVDDKGKPVDNLTANDLIVYEDSEPQQIAYFARGSSAPMPLSIVLIIDYGCSQLPVLRRIDAAKLLADKLGPKDVMAIVTDDVELVSDFSSDKNAGGKGKP